MSPDKYAILAQILRWANELSNQAEHMGDPAIETAMEMRKFVAANVTLEIESR